MTEGTSSGREPGGWELLRAVQDVKATIADMSRGFVPLAVFNLLAEDVKEARAETTAVRAELVAEVDKAKTEAASQIAAIRTELDNAKKQRAQTWTAIGLLFAGGVAAMIIDIFNRGLGLS